MLAAMSAVVRPASVLRLRAAHRGAAGALAAHRGAGRPAYVSASAAPPGGAGGLKPELRAAIDKFVKDNKVVLFMKGNKQFPQCGFSNTCVQVLNQCGVPYETVNILEDEALRTGMKEYSSWPTFPQLYVAGEFVGGCDITVAAFQDGSLKEKLEAALSS